MKISIIIVNYNGKDILKKALNSVQKSSFKDYEILVVDNNSGDGSQEFIPKNHKNVKLVQNKENLGYSGINSALPYCNGKYILFLNNDIELHRDCIKELLKVIESDDKIGMAAPRLVNYYNKKLKSGGTWVSRAFYAGHIAGNGKLKEIPYLGVGLVRKNIVDKFGYLFDKDYFIYAEDLDLGLRIRLLGYKVFFVPDAILYHMHAVTTNKGEKYKFTFLLERNMLITYLKIFSFKNVILFLPYVLFFRIITIIRDIFTLKISIAFARLSALFFIIANMRLIVKKRYETQKFRRVDDSYILKVFNEKYLLRPKFIV